MVVFDQMLTLGFVKLSCVPTQAVEQRVDPRALGVVHIHSTLARFTRWHLHCHLKSLFEQVLDLYERWYLQQLLFAATQLPDKWTRTLTRDEPDPDAWVWRGIFNLGPKPLQFQCWPTSHVHRSYAHDPALRRPELYDHVNVTVQPGELVLYDETLIHRFVGQPHQNTAWLSAKWRFSGVPLTKPTKIPYTQTNEAVMYKPHRLVSNRKS